jgi:hypothetical protein
LADLLAFYSRRDGLAVYTAKKKGRETYKIDMMVKIITENFFIVILWQPISALARSDHLVKSPIKIHRIVGRFYLTKRLWRSASVSLGKRFDDVFFITPNDVASSNGNSSWHGSAAIFARRRHESCRLGRLRWPFATSCFVGQSFSFDALQREVGPRGVVNAELDAIGIAEVEVAQIPRQMGL